MSTTATPRKKLRFRTETTRIEDVDEPDARTTTKVAGDSAGHKTNPQRESLHYFYE